MHRRKFLKSAPTLGVVGLAGCPSEPGDSGEETTRSTDKPRTATAETATSTPTAEDVELPWTQLPGPPGGPVTDIAVSPTDPDYLYTTTRTAGLYASSDGGEHWIQGPASEHHRRGIVASPHDPEEARTKQNRTVDGGRTWFSNGYKPERRRLPDIDKLRIADIEFDPYEEEILYAGTKDGIFRSTDSGKSWERVEIDAPTENDNVSWIDAASGREGVVYASYYADATVVRSDDHGASWEVIVGPDDIGGGHMVGLVAEHSGTAAYVCVDNAGAIRVGDGSPRKVGPDMPSPHFLFYDGPTLSADDERLYFHAYSLEKIEDSDIWSDMKLYEYDATTDEIRTVELPENPASITAHPTEPSTLYFGGWSWVWKSTDEGESWEDLSNKFVDRYLAAVGTNRTRPGTVIPGSICSTGLSVSHDGGQSFEWKRSGLEPYHEGKFGEHYVMRIASAGQYAYASTAAGLLISSDNGRSWRLLKNQFSGAGDLAGGVSEPAKHLHGLAINPEDPRVVYVGTGMGYAGHPGDFFDGRTELWKSSDGGENWQSITNGFPTDRDTTIQDIVVSPHDTDVVYVGTNAEDYIAGGRGPGSGTGLGVYRSTNGGSRWERLEIPFPSIHSLTLDATDPETLFASSSRYGVYRSLDGGANWERILPASTKALLAHPTEAGVLFAGTNSDLNYWDLLVSDDGGETWAQGNLTIQVGRNADQRDYDGIVSTHEFGDIMDLALGASDRILYTATRGAGLWRCEIDLLLE